MGMISGYTHEVAGEVDNISCIGYEGRNVFLYWYIYFLVVPLMRMVSWAAGCWW